MTERVSDERLAEIIRSIADGRTAGSSFKDDGAAAGSERATPWGPLIGAGIMFGIFGPPWIWSAWKFWSRNRQVEIAV